MAEKRNLCAMIPLDLFNRVGEAREKAGLTNSEYLTALLTEYYDWKENGGVDMTQENGRVRTLAFQISTDLFNRIKEHLERETKRLGHKVTQREFVIGLIEQALAQGEQGADRMAGVEEEQAEAGEESGAVSSEGADGTDTGPERHACPPEGTVQQEEASSSMV